MPKRTPRIDLARAYDPPRRKSEYRVLVDRLWPRGVRKDALDIDQWCKELAPSTELRRWFGHRVDRWPEFRKRYRTELKEMRPRLAEIAAITSQRPLLLIFGARDLEHNHAIVLREALLEVLKKRSRAK